MTKEELELEFEECFDKNTQATGGGYEADYTDKFGFYRMFEPFIYQYADQQCAEKDTQIKDLHQQLSSLKASMAEKEPSLTDHAVAIGGVNHSAAAAANDIPLVDNKGMRWVKGKPKDPSHRQKLNTKFDGDPDAIIFIEDRWCYYNDRGVYAKVRDSAWALIEYLDESESIISKGEEWIEKERLLCAAIWYKEQPTAKILPVNVKEGVVVAGMRHGHCIHSFVALTGKRSVLPECGEYTQGFITSKDRFVDRKEAMKIARESGQVTKQQSFEELYSEDLY